MSPIELSWTANKIQFPAPGGELIPQLEEVCCCSLVFIIRLGVVGFRVYGTTRGGVLLLRHRIHGVRRRR